MIEHDIKMDELFMQWTKTPAWVIRKTLNEENEEVIQRVQLTDNTEEYERPVTWAEVYSLVEQWIALDDVQYLIDNYPLIFGEPYDGEPNIYDIAKKIFSLYFPDFAVPITLNDLVMLFQWLMLMNGRLGIGCPNGCGKFMYTKLTDDLQSIEPIDLNEKYSLMWRRDTETNTIRYKCNKCDTWIKLT